MIVFKSGKVDFITPERGDERQARLELYAPPKAAQPGSVGDADYYRRCHA